MALVGKPGICSHCLTQTRAETYFKPWAWIVVVLGLLLVLWIVGIVIVIVAALVGNGRRCPKCRTENGVLDIDSPAARLLLRDAEARGVSTAPAAPRELVRNQWGGVEVRKPSSQRLEGGRWVDSD